MDAKTKRCIRVFTAALFITLKLGGNQAIIGRAMIK
jgi:hypothetical protein